MKNQIPIRHIHDFPRFSRLNPSASYSYQPASVMPGLPNNPVLKRTQSLTIVIFTVLLVSPTASVPSIPCFRPGTKEITITGKCICKTNRPYSGEKCNELKTYYPDGRVKFQVINNHLNGESEALNFSEAKKLCEDSGLDMGIPWSQEENDALFPLIREGCWLGISNEEVWYEWKYISGGRKGQAVWRGVGESGFSPHGYYTNWSPGRGISFSTGEDFPNWQRGGYLWNDHGGTFQAIHPDWTDDYGRYCDTGRWGTIWTNNLYQYFTMYCALCETPRVDIPISATASLTPAEHHQCFDGPFIIKPHVIKASDLLANGEFVFTIDWSLISHADQVLEPIVEGLLGVGTADAILVSKCNMTASSVAGRSYRCLFPPPYSSLPINESSIFLRYMPSALSWCPLGSIGVVQHLKRAAANASAGEAFAPVCPVMTNGHLDGSVYLIAATSPCAPEESQQGGKVATHIIAPFSFLGYAAGAYGNISVAVLLFLVGFGILYLGKRAKWAIIEQHPIMKHTVGFNATLIGMGFWLAELTYPGVVVGTFGLIRTGDNINIGLGAVGCVYLLLVPVMAVVVMGPFRSGYVTYEEIYVERHKLGYGMCHPLLIPQGMWGGTGPALGPVTQPFAGIRKAAWCAPLNYIVMAVVGAVLHGMSPSISCVGRLAAVAVMLGMVGVTIAVTRPFRYHINSLLYNITFGLLAMYTALLAVTASRHNVAHRSQRDGSYRAMGFAQLAIGMTICIVFLVRGAVFVRIMIGEGCNDRLID